MQAGNFILAQASRALALQGNPYVIDLLTNVIEDLVRGTRHCYIALHRFLYNNNNNNNN